MRDVCAALVKTSVMSYLSERCEVSSQHKLPTIEDVCSSTFAFVIGPKYVKMAINDLVKSGTIIQYGPYISDREIEVL